MASPEEIAQQQELLKRYRRNLGHLVKQVISFGGEDAAPVSTLNSLDDTRTNIRRIKGICPPSNPKRMLPPERAF